MLKFEEGKKYRFVAPASNDIIIGEVRGRVKVKADDERLVVHLDNGRNCYALCFPVVFKLTCEAEMAAFTHGGHYYESNPMCVDCEEIRPIVPLENYLG